MDDFEIQQQILTFDQCVCFSPPPPPPALNLDHIIV